MTDEIRGDYGLTASVPTVGPLDQWAELERLAKEATPGPWEADEAGKSRQQSVWSAGEKRVAYAPVTVFPEVARNDAAFIAAADPATVLRLIAAARANAVGAERSEVSSNTPTTTHKGEDQ